MPALDPIWGVRGILGNIPYEKRGLDLFSANTEAEKMNEPEIFVIDDAQYNVQYSRDMETAINCRKKNPGRSQRVNNLLKLAEKVRNKEINAPFQYNYLTGELKCNLTFS